MKRIAIIAALALPSAIAFPAFAQPSAVATDETVPAWVRRGASSAGHAAMAPLVGTWRVELSIYGTMGRSPDLPPIVSRDLRATRVAIANGQYIEETIEGTVAGQPYWRRGWLGYSNIDRRYEWVTVAPLVPMMIYRGAPGSGQQMPIEVTGSFTDQGVASEDSVGMAVGQRTLIRIEGPDRQVSELYFTPPGAREHLAMRMIFTRVP
jgi:hypothetical protein